MKSNTQNAKIEAITEKTLVLGIDVGSEMHYARAFDYRGIEYSKKPFKFSNTEAGFVTFKEWILDLKERHEKDKVVPGMEPTGHYWFNLGKFLQDNEMKPVLVNPHHVKKSKELDDNNPTKNDRKDPKVIAGLVREGRYMIPYLPEGVYADLRTASNIRFRYMGYLISLSIYSFKGIKVGLDCANGSSWNIAKSVFDALGADTYVINNKPNGLNINNNAGSTHIEGLQRFVVENGLDAGFTFDGDADRCPVRGRERQCYYWRPYPVHLWLLHERTR